MTFRIPVLLSLVLLGSCARQNYFQTDALYPSGGTSNSSTEARNYTVTAGRHYQKNKLHQLVWGKHYRQVWATPVVAPALDLETTHGGLVPVALGGGLQSTSLALKNKSGAVFTLRTLDKDPAKSIRPFLRKTFLANLMRDQTSAINPYAAFVVPTLAEAAKIYHTNPSLYYVPQTNTSLGEYSPAFRGKVVMLEEKFTEKKSLTKDFNNAIDLIDSKTFFKNYYSSASHRVDKLGFAQARLFDVLLLDWDRHVGQWNWAVVPTENTGDLFYKPVPKDRDQAFYLYDGLIPWLTTRKLLTQPFKILRHNRQDVAGLIYKGRFLDERLLNEVTREEWISLAKAIQTDLTDSILKEAVNSFPAPIQNTSGAYTLNLLKTRRDNLVALADEFYSLLAKKVTVAGTEQKERFLITRSDEKTIVQIFNLPVNSAEKSVLLYKREFSPTETKQITLQGLGQNDEFIVEGTAKQSPLLVMYGGEGQDFIKDHSFVSGAQKKTVVYDSHTQTTLDLGKEAKNKTSDQKKIENYPLYDE